MKIKNQPEKKQTNSIQIPLVYSNVFIAYFLMLFFVIARKLNQIGFVNIDI